MWLILLPFTLWAAYSWFSVLLSGIFAFLMFGIDEIGVQIEEPFGWVTRGAEGLVGVCGGGGGGGGCPSSVKAGSYRWSAAVPSSACLQASHEAHNCPLVTCALPCCPAQSAAAGGDQRHD